MNEYLDVIYPSGTVMSQLLRSLQAPNGKHGKKAAVLKADIFRYTILLHKGGIYADVDTAAVKKFDDWGRDAMDMVRSSVHLPISSRISLIMKYPLICADILTHKPQTDQLIAQIPRVIHGDISFTSSLSQSLPAPPPALIVAIEKSNDPAWRGKSMARGLQVVQWTIAAQPGHPVFLDVLNRIVARWLDEERRVLKGRSWEGDDEDATVLDWTGPGPWSDAVVRYVNP